MSYNVDTIDIVASAGFRVSIDALAAIHKEIEAVPEGNLFDQAEDDNAQEFWEPDGVIWWYGEGSGHSFDAFVERVLPIFDGSADLIVCWEGGDSYSGLRLRDHKVTKHEVVMKLGEESDG
jgi:hypothetical protein